MVEPFPVDFVKHAESMGALARRCESLADLEEAMKWAQGTDRTTLITIDTDAFAWVPGDADWDVGVPEVSERAERARGPRQAGRDPREAACGSVVSLADRLGSAPQTGHCPDRLVGTTISKKLSAEDKDLSAVHYATRRGAPAGASSLKKSAGRES